MECLAQARTLGVPVTFCLFVRLSHPSPWLVEGEPQPKTGFYGCMRKGWHGTQAILLPHERLERIAARASFGDGDRPPFDVWLKRTGLISDLVGAFPNPVQHRSPPSVRDPRRKPRHSLTYHLPRNGSWKGD